MTSGECKNLSSQLRAAAKQLEELDGLRNAADAWSSLRDRLHALCDAADAEHTVGLIETGEIRDAIAESRNVFEQEHPVKDEGAE